MWEWSPAGMPRWFSRRLCTFLSSPALTCSGGSLPSEALGAPRCPTAGGSAGLQRGAGRSAALSRSRRCARFCLFGSARLGCASWLLSLLWIRRRSRTRDTGPLRAVLSLSPVFVKSNPSFGCTDTYRVYFSSKPVELFVPRLRKCSQSQL